MMTDNFRESVFCFEERYKSLADLASAEKWGDEYSVLKNYCSKLFQRAVQLDKDHEGSYRNKSGSYLVIHEDNNEDGYACFNTGLYTPRFEMIYALLVPNEVPNKQPWFLKGFYKESDPALGAVAEFPERVSFVDDPVDLVFDFRLPIRINVDHILGDEDNYQRIPEHIRNLGEVAVRRLFAGAVKETESRVAANYTLAVSQFYNGRVQLLLPICLDGITPELALVIQREDGYYSARTCLTLDMAYNNARLIVRPEASWITQ